jgi:hypothetical protein
VDFTREPIIESVITPKEGSKLVIRSSKGVGQEEFFVDAVEIVSFGHTFFLRSLERPKSFLVPATDYEILEVRETRMVLKNVGIDRAIKIGGGREAKRIGKESEENVEGPLPTEDAEIAKETKLEPRGEKRREKRRQQRKKRGKEEVGAKEKERAEEAYGPEGKIDLPPPEQAEEEGILGATTAFLSTLLPPPPNLISETIERYRDNEMFKNVFFPKGQKSLDDDDDEQLEEDDLRDNELNLEEDSDSNLALQTPLQDINEGNEQAQYFDSESPQNEQEDVSQKEEEGEPKFP